ncbi:YbjN domain-containing protein [Orrella sp. JC864]|uniref:YbjN domain-containing protein n=1 Tax=Orrella sp. JC864 TaxID=3120298 RepID=UPI0030092171
MTETTLIQSIGPARLQELLQSVGYRVTLSEQNGLVQLLSATQGIGFAVRMGNPAQQQGEFVDYTLSCALRVQGELPAGLVENWNVAKRFARLTQQGVFLVLEMDVILAGGVSENYLRATTELWDRLLQEFVLFLRQYAAQAAQQAGQAAEGDAAAADDAATETGATAGETEVAAAEAGKA